MARMTVADLLEQRAGEQSDKVLVACGDERRTYRQAAEWIKQNPAEAAALIAPKANAEDQKAMADLIRSNERLSMHVAPAAGMQKEIEAVYKAGQDVGYFPKAPSGDSILITCAPNSARMREQNGPAINVPSSNTLMSDSGPTRVNSEQ